MEWLRGAAWIDDDAIVLDTASATSYQPLAEPHIGIELARVHNNDEVVAFVRRYGLLRTKPPKTRGAPLRESLNRFLRITREVRESWSWPSTCEELERGTCLRWGSCVTRSRFRMTR